MHVHATLLQAQARQDVLRRPTATQKHQMSHSRTHQSMAHASLGDSECVPSFALLAFFRFLV